MSRIYKFYRNISTLIYLAVLLITYAYMPEKVGYLFNEFREPIKALSRGNYFYLFLGLLFVINIMLYLFEVQVLGHLTNIHNKSLRIRLTDWVRVFMGTSNMFVVLIMFFLVLINSPDFSAITQIVYLVYFGLAMIIGCLVWLVAIALKQDKVES